MAVNSLKQRLSSIVFVAAENSASVGINDDLLDQLCQGHHIDPFNLYWLKSLLSIFKSEKKALGKVIKMYEKEKEAFLESTTVSQFQRAVVEKVTVGGRVVFPSSLEEVST